MNICDKCENKCASFFCDTCVYNSRFEDHFKEKMKPCPFCGSEARIVHASEDNEWLIECSDIECNVSTGWYGTRKEVYEIWNRRVSK